MSQKSIKLNNIQYKKFLEKLNEKNVTSTEFPGNKDYELIRFKKDKEFLVVYKNKTILFSQESEFELLINEVITSNIDELYENYDLIIGSDEVGKGEWYGPLITIAVCLKKEEIPIFQMLGVKDSKNLNEEQIFSLFRKSNEVNFQRQSVVVNPQRLNTLWKDFTRENKNYNELIAWEHQRAILDILKKVDTTKKILIIIDKFDVKKVDKRLKDIQQKKNIDIIQISRGESHIPVALASIIAKKVWYEKIKDINRQYNLELPKSPINDVRPQIVHEIGKLFFKNVRKIINAYILKKNIENLLEMDIGEIDLFNEEFKGFLRDIFKAEKNINNYLTSAFNFESESFKAPEDSLNSKRFVTVIENEEKSIRELKNLKARDPDFAIKRFIIHQLNQKLDELDNIDFKLCLKPKDRIAKTISAFCNRYILTKIDSFIVFGVKDIKDMSDDFLIEDRIISFNQMLEASKVSTPEQFLNEINKLVRTHLNPCPDSCYSIKSLNLKDYGPFRKDREIIIIHIKDFNLNRPIYFKGKIYIRKSGQDLNATPEEIEQLVNKINRDYK